MEELALLQTELLKDMKEYLKDDTLKSDAEQLKAFRRFLKHKRDFSIIQAEFDGRTIVASY